MRAILVAGGLVVMVTFFALAWRRARERRRRWKQDLCRECGYDLRGSAERCPECGARIIRDPTSVRTMTVRDDRT